MDDDTQARMTGSTGAAQTVTVDPYLWAATLQAAAEDGCDVGGWVDAAIRDALRQRLQAPVPSAPRAEAIPLVDPFTPPPGWRPRQPVA
jgi:hypothetical protein